MFDLDKSAETSRRTYPKDGASAQWWALSLTFHTQTQVIFVCLLRFFSLSSVLRLPVSFPMVLLNASLRHLRAFVALCTNALRTWFGRNNMRYFLYVQRACRSISRLMLMYWKSTNKHTPFKRHSGNKSWRRQSRRLRLPIPPVPLFVIIERLSA